MQGLDFEDTFSPLVRLETMRVFLALAAQLEWSVSKLDVRSAFLNGELKEEMYVEQPKRFTVRGREEKVYRLKKALYRLRQAPSA